MPMMTKKEDDLHNQNTLSTHIRFMP